MITRDHQPIARLLAEEKPIVLYVDRILNAKRAEVAADLMALDREIDERVYALRGLAAEEIKRVQGAAK